MPPKKFCCLPKSYEACASVHVALRVEGKLTPELAYTVLVAAASVTACILQGPVAEFNIQTDPEAAKIVFESGVDLTMMPLEVRQHDSLLQQGLQ